ncbi:McrBC 5-methylcytosine restriction system component [Thermopolyspora flexuosa]|uniref:5-methylcytosine-specific restriction enzyme subunit McrC n=2 Tax=Thermopolyspora flexuosa TaxID=103836 RepID=A0A543J3P9_9ACTN|nr:5-methylcytosine-specific restriction enzyme subunit McrC [Thermopolyspora flexuosa]GGM73236.1 McrBC 5-methylcytosine restriction system component [Thermopolyspora flexuosa]
MIRIQIAETGPAVSLRLTEEQGRRLAASGVVRARPSPFDRNLWEVQARDKVGVAVVGDVEVWITPKLSIDRLLFLIGYATDPKGWREETARLDVREGLLPTVAHSLCRQAERALRGGLLQGYQVVEDASYVMRGRLREADQLRRHHGRVIPMEVRHDDFTMDIPENRILLGAVNRLLTVPRLDNEARRRLLALRNRLAPVTLPIPGTAPPAWHPTRLNARYHSALRLAEIVWRATSPEHSPGEVVANTFLFDLAKIFESFVTVALAEEVHARHGGAVRPQYTCHLDESHTITMRPDLVWEFQGRPAAVADAKYKPQRSKGFVDGDIYQMLAYCTALNLPEGHLIYAKGNAIPAHHVIRHAGVRIICHALDLTASPNAILGQINELAAQLTKTIMWSS